LVDASPWGFTLSMEVIVEEGGPQAKTDRL
jgi:hypothetical protein